MVPYSIVARPCGSGLVMLEKGVVCVAAAPVTSSPARFQRYATLPRRGVYDLRRPAYVDYSSAGRTVPLAWRVGARGLRGLGQGGPGSAAAGAGIKTGLAITSQAIASGTSLASSATWLAAAGGPIGLAVVGVTIALTALFSRKKPGQKRATTAIVNDVEPHLQENLRAYFAGPRTAESQAQALANFDAGWQYVVESCNTEAMGDPGQWCINDRKAGACKWQKDGACWNWFSGYRDPIANDAATAAAPASSGAQQEAQQAGAFSFFPTFPTLPALSPAQFGMLAALALGGLFLLASSGGARA